MNDKIIVAEKSTSMMRNMETMRIAFARAVEQQSGEGMGVEVDAAHDFGTALAAILSALEHSGSHPGLDGLTSADSGPVARCNRRAASLYGAGAARLVVSGSSGANIMVNGILLPGLLARGRRTVLIDRDCHMSMVGAFVVSGLQPVWITRRYDSANDVPIPLTRADVEGVMDRHPEAGAFILTCPTYDGFGVPLEELSEMCRSRDLLFIIDAAWGPCHGPLNNIGFPKSAIQRGADIAVTSLHKKGFAPSQVALVLFREPAHAAHFDAIGTMGFQTTSPNYVLLGLTEPVIDDLASGLLTQEWHKAIATAKAFGQSVGSVAPGCRLVDAADVGAEAGDPCHVLVNVAGAGVVGYDVLSAMNEMNYHPEKATRDTILFLFGPSSDDDLVGLRTAFAAAVSACAKLNPSARRTMNLLSHEPNHVVMPIREAVMACSTVVALSGANGCTSAQPVAVYPPGSALFMPGERITSAHIAHIHAIRFVGGRVRGLNQNDGDLVRIVA